MQEKKYDVAIVGGGIVGMASAYKLQLKFPNLNIIVIEKEKSLAEHQTGRNSGVIHSGLYYRPGSLRSKNCFSGRVQLVKFAQKYNINHEICGKIVLATNHQESNRLIDLKKNGEKNGLTGLKILDQDEIKKIEPFAVGLCALWVPQSGIIDYKSVTNKFADLILEINPKSKILKKCQVLEVKDNLLISNLGSIVAKNTIFCGGLFSDRLAEMDNVKIDTKIVGFRGDYYELTKEAANKVQNLIYPVPNPDFPFLGVHFTRMTDGCIECGPNAVFTFKREGYHRLSFNLKDTLDSLGFVGTWKLFINNWKFGLKEYRRAFSKRLFLKELRKMVPSLNMNDLKIGRSGVRAMALDKNGVVLDDFKIINHMNHIHVLNAPSPAATACLSIADHVVNNFVENCYLNT